jgi:hypothetical protein
VDPHLMICRHQNPWRVGSEQKDRLKFIGRQKCPADLSMEEQNAIKDKLKVVKKTKRYILRALMYDAFVYLKIKTIRVSETVNADKFIVAGSACFYEFYLQKRPMTNA